MRNTPELVLFRKTVYDFCRKEIYPYRLEWEKAKATPRGLFKQMGEMGFFGLRYPQELGGSAQDFYYTEAFGEEMVRASELVGPAVNIQVHMDMATPILNILGTSEQKQEFLVPAIQGDKIFALGISEPNTGSDVANIRTTAKSDGGDYVINGAKTFITNGSLADYITLAVRTGDAGHRGVSLVVFDTKTRGFSVGRKLDKIGCHTSDTAELHFDNCRISKRNLIGEENQGFYYIMQNFQAERLIIAIDAVALGKIMLGQALSYMSQRTTFGKRLADYQVLRHELVDLATELKCAHLLNQHATDLLVAKKDFTTEISMAKLKATELVNRIAVGCQQVFGGYGYMEEYEIARHFRDSRVLNIVGGTSHIMKEIVAKRMFAS